MNSKKKIFKKIKKNLRELISGDRTLVKRIFSRTQRREWGRMRRIGFLNLWRVRRRQKNKHVYIDRSVLDYTESLVNLRFTDQILNLRSASEAMTNSELQIDIGEASFLRFLVSLTRASQVLEIGTFRGFSTAVIAEALIENELENNARLSTDSQDNHIGGGISCITTIELRPEEAREAEVLWTKHLNDMVRSRIHMIIGDGVSVLDTFVSDARSESSTQKSFDLIFIDANKSQYSDYLVRAKQIIRPGGLIVIDNTLNAGLVATSAIDRTTNSLRSLNMDIFSSFDPDFEPILIPAWDGVVIVRRKNSK